MNENSDEPNSDAREAICSLEVSWMILVLFVSANSAVLLLVPLARRTAAGAFLRGDAWWENLNLFAVLLSISFVITIALGRMRLCDVGLRASKLLQGLGITALAWLVMQTWPYVASGNAELSRIWSDPGPLVTVRWALVMLLATALWEEVAFRGFLLPQIYFRTRGNHAVRLVLAVLVSQTVFAAAHVPAHIMIRHLSGWPLMHMLLLQAFAGALLALVYLRTRNLWVCIGLHGLANAPTPLVGGAMTWELPLFLILVAWPLITRTPEGRGFANLRKR